ncbi:hypothetical protein [Halomonas sp. PR-M31]|uniref:hypothetical protein n=1 Tax=Halomonas sp. PR-M31 TaxID=1471202 RepID=UPI000A489F87|nr:hypothetical protein [Halomonas sp. PR-M31]
MMRACLVLLLVLLPTLASAGTLVGIVSERSAAELAAGAARFLDAYPDHRVVLRTPEQLAKTDDAELDELLNDADALLLAAVFGEQTGRLARLVETAAARRDFPILAVNGDRRLTRLSRLSGEWALAGLDAATLGELVASPDAEEAATEHLAAQRERFPGQAEWLTGRAYYQGRSPSTLTACCAG